MGHNEITEPEAVSLLSLAVGMSTAKGSKVLLVTSITSQGLQTTAMRNTRY